MKKTLLATTLLVAIPTGHALAQTAPAANVLEEIVVTAQQRSENLQRAAISVTAVGGEGLAKAGIVDMNQLTNLVPAFRSTASNGPYDKFSLRGISNFTSNALQDNGIVVNISGVPLARPTGAHGLFYDLERVEVLKGPQGILYGRNATGGVVNLIPRRPGHEFSGNIGIDLGSYDLAGFTGGVDAPISDKLTTRTAFQVIKRDGYYDDGTGDEDGAAVRFTAVYDPTDDLQLSLVGDWAHDGGNGPGASLIYGSRSGRSGFVAGARSGLNNPNPLVQAQFVAIGGAPRLAANTFQDNTYWGVTGTGVWHNPLGDLTVIAAHRQVEQDYENTVPTFYQGEVTDAHQDSLEMRLASASDGPWKWIIGGFGLREEGQVQQLNEQGTGLSNSDINFTNTTLGVFGQLTYSISDALRVSGGLRYSTDHKESYSPRRTIANYPFATQPLTPRVAVSAGTFASLLDQDESWDSVTYKVGVEYDLRADSLLYANVSTGFKAGGFTFGPPGGLVYDPEKVTAFTAGSKNRFFDGTLQLNVEAFYLSYQDQQLQHFGSLPGIGNFTLTENIGKSTIYGVEWDAIYLLGDNTRLNFSGQYLKGTYDEFTYVSPTSQATSQTCPETRVATGFSVDCSGRTLINAPEWVVQAGIEHSFPLASGAKIVASLSTRYESSRETQINYFPETKVEGFGRSDASIAYNAPGDTWSVTAYVKNLEDTEAYGLVLPGRTYSTTTGGILAASLEPPRTYGLRFGAKF